VEWFRDWVRTLVTVLLFGTLLEFLLPRTALARAARMAVGLVVVLVVLQPLMALLGGRLELDRLAPGELWGWPQPAPPGSGLPGPALGTDMKRWRETRTLEVYRALLNQRAELEALAVPGVGRARARVEVGEDASGPDFARPVRITLVVWPREPAGRGAAVAPEGGNGGLERVEPVRIRVGEGPAPASPRPAPVTVLPEVLDAVRSRVAERFGLPASLVAVLAGEEE